MKCFKCGAQLKENGKFCPKCGANQGFSEELITKAKDGSQDAIAELYNRTYNSVYFTVKSLVKDEDAALDIVQDSYVKGFRSLGQLKEADKFRAWMKTIAHNKAIDHLRKNKPMIFSQMSTDSDEAVEFEDERPENLPEVVVDQKETTRLVKEILDSLSDEQRLAVGMFYYEQMSVREIAEVLGVSENTVKSRLAYGRKKIELQVKELEKRGTKLYSLAPLPFFLALLGNLDTQAAAPSAEMLGRICQSCGEAAQFAGQTGTAGMAGASGAAGASGSAGGAGIGSAVQTAAAATGKSIMMKVVAGITATVVIGAGVTGGFLWKEHKEEQEAVQIQQEKVKQEAEKKEKEKKEEAAESKAEETAPTKEDIFQPVLEEYREVIKQTAQRNEMPVYDENHPNVNSSAMRWHYDYIQNGSLDSSDTGLYYSYYDIDKNGADELLIGRGAVGMLKDVVDVYTIKDGKPNKLFHIQDDGTMIYVYTDGTMEAQVFNGDTTDRYGYNFTEDGTAVEEHMLEGETESKTAVEDIQWEILAEGEEQGTDTGDALSVYNSLLEEYQEAMKASEYDEEKYPNVNSTAWYAKKQISSVELQYAYYDIDGNGMQELLVGFGSGEQKQIAAIYGAGDNKGELLLEIPNEYTTCSIYPDGKIKMEYYDGGELTDVETYMMSVDGTEAQLISETDETTGQKQITDFQWMDF